MKRIAMATRHSRFSILSHPPARRFRLAQRDAETAMTLQAEVEQQREAQAER
jgi:hypothetical protein